MMILLSLPLLLILFSLGRAWLSEQGSLASVGCNGCLILPTIQHDLVLLAVFLMASILWVKLPRYIKWFALLIQAGLILVITTDLIILAEFGMGLSWHDIIKFGGEFKAIEGYLGAKLTTITGILTLILLSSWIGYLRAVSYLDQRGINRVMMGALACLLLYALPISARHPLPWLYRNVMEINLPSDVEAYSQTYQAYLQAAYKPPPLNSYETHFLPPLDSMHKGTWLKRLGFHNVEGDDHPFYQGIPRFAFNAAHDGWLYGRFLDWLDHQAPRDRPYLAVLETVTTHPPLPTLKPVNKMSKQLFVLLMPKSHALLETLSSIIFLKMDYSF